MAEAGFPQWSKAEVQNWSRRRVTSYVDVHHTWWSQRFPKFAHFFVSSRCEAIVGVAILVNCITIGMEADSLLVPPSDAVAFILKLSKHVSTLFFFIEFLIRWLFCGWQVYIPGIPFPHMSHSERLCNAMDAALVLVTGVAFVWILPLLNVQSGKSMRLLTAFRSFRLFRLVRVIKRSEEFHDVYLLIQGLVGTARVLIWTVLLLAFISYIFAVFGVVLISVDVEVLYESEQDPEDKAALKELLEQVGGVDNWMYTLVQVLTQDSWNAIARPLMKQATWTWTFFYIYIAVTAIVFMNLVTAVIVENALATSKQDEEALLHEKEIELHKTFKKFRDLFQAIDTDEDGSLTWDEFEEAFESPEVATKLKLMNFKPEECKQLFNILDEGDGCLTLNEWFDGLQSMKGEAQSKDVYILQKRVAHLTSMLSVLGSDYSEDREVFRKHFGLEMDERVGTLEQRGRARAIAHDSLVPKTPNSACLNPKQVGEIKEGSKEAAEHRKVTVGEKLDELLQQMEVLRAGLSKQVVEMTSRLERVEETTAGCVLTLQTQAKDAQLQEAAAPQARRTGRLPRDKKPYSHGCVGAFATLEAPSAYSKV